MPSTPLRIAFAAAAVLLVAGCDAVAPGSGPGAVAAEGTVADARRGQSRVAVCHYDAEAGTYARLTVAAPAVRAHRRHGDALPGEPVPTEPGATFDESCAPILAETVFAIAYTDADPTDGPGFVDGLDVVISKLVDANGDGAPSAGDEVRFGLYPTDTAASGAIAAGRDALTVASVDDSIPGRLTVRLSSEAGIIREVQWISTDLIGAFYRELTAVPGVGLSTTFLIDNPGDGAFDRVVVEPGSPGEPAGSASELVPGVDDGAFLDVEIDLAGV